MIEQLKRFAGTLVLMILALMIVGVAALLVLMLTADDPVDNAPKLRETEGRISVAEERVPRNYQEALEAAPVEVLPSYLPADVSEAPAAGAERARLERSVGAFLRAWETYSPGAPAYREAVAKHAVPSAVARLVLRDEVEGQGNACYTGGTCLMRSRWVGGTPSIEIMSLEGGRAWVNAHGLVDLRPIASGIETDPQAGTYERAYSLMLRFDPTSGRWLAERALAETLPGTIG